MEGPSLYLAKQQLRPFKGRVIQSVSGNTTIAKERFQGKVVKDIFSWGKHLVFQFDDFALRVHFLLYGTFEARIGETWVTGDYRRARTARLAFGCTEKGFDGEINMYNCSVKFIESKRAKDEYDFTIDTMSPKWDPANAYKNTKSQSGEMIADVLLDQEIFAGVGNIIKNEILSIAYINPKTLVRNLSPKKLKDLITLAQSFSKQFYRWRKAFVLRKHLLIHRKGSCPHCNTKIIREKAGKRARWAYWCPVCQPLS